MNVFVLNTGRCGSTTFARACKHITNFTSAHESLSEKLGEARFAFPPNHIEADNRLSWFLGRLERAYGQDAVYVHLTRDPEAVARSFTNRYKTGIIWAYRTAILMGLPRDTDPLKVAEDYCATVTVNIEAFLKDKPKKMSFALENAAEDFKKFWDLIDAEGELEAALSEFKVPHNAHVKKNAVSASTGKIKRVVKKLPAFLRDV